MFRWILLTVTLIMAALIVSVAVAEAAPGGQGKGNVKATMSVEGEPFAAFGAEEYTIDGSGFEADQLVFLSFATPGCCAGVVIVADGSGDWSFSRATGTPGIYVFTALQEKRNGKIRWMASVSFTVQ